MNERGYTLVEIVVVAMLLGIVASVAIPRALRTSPEMETYRAAADLTRDLEMVRSRAIAAKRALRVRFDPSKGFYTVFADTSADRSGTFTESQAEVRESRLLVRGVSGGLPGVLLPERVQFGSGAAGKGPRGEPTGTVVVSSGGYSFDMDSRGLMAPLGTTAIIYLVHAEDPSAVAAVTVSGAGSIQAWRFINGEWVR